jgi:hypothetical protein
MSTWQQYLNDMFEDFFCERVQERTAELATKAEEIQELTESVAITEEMSRQLRTMSYLLHILRLQFSRGAGIADEYSPPFSQHNGRHPRYARCRERRGGDRRHRQPTRQIRHYSLGN